MRFRSCSPTLAPRPWLTRMGALLALCALVVTTTGCFGTFPLTRTVYKENQDISDVEFHQTLTYWVMILTLVYPGALLTDMIVMNTIEFWQPEPTDWQASGAYVPVPSNRYESLDARPEPPAPVSAPAMTSPARQEIPVMPASNPPGTDSPSLSPTVPLPLPPLAPVFEDSTPQPSSLTLSQASPSFVSP